MRMLFFVGDKISSKTSIIFQDCGTISLSHNINKMYRSIVKAECLQKHGNYFLLFSIQRTPGGVFKRKPPTRHADSYRIAGSINSFISILLCVSQQVKKRKRGNAQHIMTGLSLVNPKIRCTLGYNDSSRRIYAQF